MKPTNWASDPHPRIALSPATDGAGSRGGRIAARRQLAGRVRRKLLAIVLLPLMVYAITTDLKPQQPITPAAAIAAGVPSAPNPRLDKRRLQRMIGERPPSQLDRKRFDVTVEGRRYRVETSLDPQLQQLLQESIDTDNSQAVGIVAMDPDDGRVLAMAGFDRHKPANNPCLESSFPAASIFKIVTAAAAVERFRLDSESKLFYTGGRHTLYRSQISDKPSKYAHNITLRDSFAHSVNAVFGKLGALKLGADVLESYAARFGFNRTLPFELPVEPSRIVMPDDTFGLAEIASGYNRTTKISPLHGALLASAVLNQGVLLEPTIVDRVADESGATVYRGERRAVQQAISPKTCRVMSALMTETVDSGTGRRAFRGYRSDPVLKQLIIGGKSGTINNDSQDTRYDWFVAFATDRRGGDRLAVAAVVAHGDLLGKRSADYVRMAIREYFHETVASAKSSGIKADG